MRANDNKSHLPYLNKTIDRYSSTYHHCIYKKTINAYYSASTEKTETNSKAPNDRVRITRYKYILVKVTLKIGQDKYLLPILRRKLILDL